MAEPGARERYGQRMATIEPVFSNIEDVMAYRRAPLVVDPVDPGR